MNAGQLLMVIDDIISGMRSKGLLHPDGVIVINTPDEIVIFSQIVEAALKAHGVAVPDKIDKFVSALPMLVALFS